MSSNQLALDFSPEDNIRLDNTGTKQPLAGVTTTKIIKSGNLIEVYDYEYPIRFGHKGKATKKKKTKSVRSEEYRVRTIVQAINTLRQLCFLNFTLYDKFITLTFNNEQAFDITNLKVCYHYVQLFLRKLKRRYPDLKYIVVAEFQKRGAVHYHILANIPFITEEERIVLWPYGFSKVLAVQSTTQLALYLSKYLGKRFDDKRKFGHKLYTTSKGLRKPKVIYGPIAEEASEKIKELPQLEVQYENQYETERNGVTKYKQYLKKET